MPSLKPAQLAFFSYAHEDAEFALRLAKDLRAGGAAVWIDRLDIKPGQRWDRAIEDALAKCPQLLVILSPDATESTNVMDEVSLALEEGKTVLPVVHRQCKIPFRLRRLQYVDLTLNYNEGLGRLLETLGLAVPPSEVPDDAMDEELTRVSKHDGGAKEAKLLSHAAPQEQEAATRMPKKRAPSVMVFAGTAAVLIALALLALVLNAFKEKKKKSSEEVSQGPTTSLTPLSAGGLRTPEPAATVAETPRISLSESTSPTRFKVDTTRQALETPEPSPTVAEERARDRESAIAYTKSGTKKAQMGDFAGALADYDHAIELDPEFVDAYKQRATAKEMKGDLTGALDDYNRAIEIDPKHSLAYLNRALIHYDIRDFRAAIDDFQRAIEISPNAEWFRLFVWLAEMHLGQRERADRGLADYFGDRINAPGHDRHARIAAFFLDKLTLAEFLSLKSPSDSQELFYAGMKCLFTGYKNQAARYLRSSVEINRGGPWGLAAQAELKTLEETGSATATATTAMESAVSPAASIPNFAGIWAETNPKGAAHPMRLKVVQSGAQIACYISYTQVFSDRAFLQATISQGRATTSIPQGCGPRFQKPGYNYDNPGVNIFNISLRGSILVYEQETKWTSPCDGHPIGTEQNIRKLRRVSQ